MFFQPSNRSPISKRKRKQSPKRPPANESASPTSLKSWNTLEIPGRQDMASKSTLNQRSVGGSGAGSEQTRYAPSSHSESSAATSGLRRSRSSDKGSTVDGSDYSAGSVNGQQLQTQEGVVTRQPQLFTTGLRGRGGGEFSEEQLNLVDSCSVICCFPCIFLLKPFIFIQEYERAVIFRLGTLHSGGARGPGVSYLNPFMDEHVTVDMRVACQDVPTQEVLTQDGLTIFVDAVVFYRVRDAVLSCCNVTDYREATMRASESSLRQALGNYTLTQILEAREDTTQTIHTLLKETTANWGIYVLTVEMKNLWMPAQLIRNMSQEAEATRLARAKVTLSEGEERAAEFLRKASQNLEGKSAVTLRDLETLLVMAGKSRSTMVIPLPFPADFFLLKPTATFTDAWS